MTARPAVITLLIEKRLHELVQELPPVSTYELGACKTSDTELFFAEAPAAIAQAKSICQTCPIRMQCLIDAINRNEFGIWGGTTDEERELIKSNGGVGTGVTHQLENLPTLEDAASQISEILVQPVSKVCSKYKVEPRTVHRWRSAIKSDPQALQLANHSQTQKTAVSNTELAQYPNGLWESNRFS